MRLQIIGRNMTTLTLTDGVTTVLFSYETPVAAYLESEHGFIVTDQFYSSTTQRHIKKWLDGVTNYRTVTQDTLDNLVKAD